MGSQLLLRWDNHLPSFACSMKECLDDGDLTDLTISCQGRVLHCHKLVLSVASPHFKQLLKANPGQHPIVIMRDIPYKDISALLTFIYQGEVTVTEEDLPSFLKTAKALEVRGLADDAQPGGPAVSHAKQEARRAPHLEPEVVVKEEPCDQDEQEASRHDSSVAMTTVNDISLLQHGSPAANDRFPVGGSFEVRPAHLTPKTEAAEPESSVSITLVGAGSESSCSPRASPPPPPRRSLKRSTDDDDWKPSPKLQRETSGSSGGAGDGAPWGPAFAGSRWMAPGGGGGGEPGPGEADPDQPSVSVKTEPADADGVVYCDDPAPEDAAGIAISGTWSELAEPPAPSGAAADVEEPPPAGADAEPAPTEETGPPPAQSEAPEEAAAAGQAEESGPAGAQSLAEATNSHSVLRNMLENFRKHLE